MEGTSKPGRYLPWQLKKRKEKKIVTKIIEDGKEVVNQNGIKRVFFQFYAKLFKKQSIAIDKIKEYLENLELLKVPEDIKKFLNEPTDTEEILKAIEATKLGKAPGPDGITAKYYRLLKNELAPVLKLVLNEIMSTKEMPKSWREATISLISKETQDLMLVKNYRPISLLNYDYKNYIRIIAERIKVFLKDSIGEEQAGFLPNRQIWDNLRVVVDAVEYYDKHPEKVLGFFFAEAKKAFDNINWDFMIVVLEKMEFGETIINSIKAIHSEQQATLCKYGLDREFF